MTGLRILVATAVVATSAPASAVELLSCRFDQVCAIGQPCAPTSPMAYDVEIDGGFATLMRNGAPVHLSNWLDRGADQVGFFQPSLHGFDVIDVDADLNAVLVRSEGVLDEITTWRGHCTKEPT